VVVVALVPIREAIVMEMVSVMMLTIV